MTPDNPDRTLDGSEPLTTAEAKDHLRVTQSDEDAMVDHWVKTARKKAEAETWRTFVPSTYTYYLDEFPTGRDPLSLPYPPVTSIGSIDYTDSNDSSQSFTDYESKLNTGIPKVRPTKGNMWPTDVKDTYEPITITYEAGYDDGTVSRGTQLPEDVVDAIKLILGHLYDNRSDVEVREGNIDAIVIPKSSKYLLSWYSVRRYV